MIHTLKPKSKSLLMRAIGAVLGSRFMKHYWTTIGSTIYHPSRVIDPNHRRYAPILEHELVHVEQWKKWGPLFSISYLLFPIPFGLAWFRWRWEREAYMVQLRENPNLLVIIVDELGSGMYLWCWPKTWMRTWFQKELGR